MGGLRDPRQRGSAMPGADTQLRRFVEDPGPEGSALLERMLRGIPLRRLAEAEEIAAAIHFLCSDASSMITGVLLPVDGGNLSLNAGGTPR